MKPILIAAGAWCVLLTFLVFREYAIYQLTRWGICGAAVYGAFHIRNGWRWPLVAVAILFNPIAPLYLGRDVWKVMDAIAAAVFFLSAALGKLAPTSES